MSSLRRTEPGVHIPIMMVRSASHAAEAPASSGLKQRSRPWSLWGHHHPPSSTRVRTSTENLQFRTTIALKRPSCAKASRVSLQRRRGANRCLTALIDVPEGERTCDRDSAASGRRGENATEAIISSPRRNPVDRSCVSGRHVPEGDGAIPAAEAMRSHPDECSL